MSSVSAAISKNRLARVSGYEISKLVKTKSNPTLPQSIAVLSQAKTGYAGSLDPVEITTAKQAGELYGFGSPIHLQFLTLRPENSDGVGGIPTMAYPVHATLTQESKQIFTLSTSGSGATIASTNTLYINGIGYDYFVPKGSSAESIVMAVSELINSIQNSPCESSINDGNKLAIKSKTMGLIGDFNIRFESPDDANITYALTYRYLPAGDTSDTEIKAALSKMIGKWHTILINGYDSPRYLNDIEDHNGNPTDKSGNYLPYVFNPFVSISGSTKDDAEDNADDVRIYTTVGGVTNVVAVCGNSQSRPWQISASVGMLLAIEMDSNPQLDISNQKLPNVIPPVNSDIGDSATYDRRDYMVKNGVATTSLRDGQYVIEDLVTTYREPNESPLQYSYVRNLMIDWNIKYGYTILEANNVRDRVLIPDGQPTNVSKSISPKQWKAILFAYFDNLALRGLINDAQFSKDSLIVEIDADNPNRFNTNFRYQRTGLSRIQSTSVQAGF